MINYGKQNISAKDIDAVINVLKSDFLTQGPMVTAFEKALSSTCSAKYAIAACNATACLHVACLSLGVSQEDIVWTSPISFVASANCALYCGAQVDFVDIDLNTGLMCPEKLEEKLISAKKNNKLPKVVIPVHLAGQSCDMKKIHLLGEKFNFKIIEDASHAIGASYFNQNVGSCKYSDITVFSFHPVKIITTGEGGAALTNNQDLAQKMRQLCNHGTTRDPNQMTSSSHGPWYYQQIELGHNYRLTDIQSALGISQLEKLQEIVSKRNKLALYYNKLITKSTMQPLNQLPHNYSSYHLYIIKLLNISLPQKVKLFDNLLKSGIQANLHYIPIHLQPYYQKIGFKKGMFANAEKYYEQAITLPLYPELRKEQQGFIIEKIEENI